jgi:formimidoylglutamate deiminase
MQGRKLQFGSALTAKGWQENVTIEIDGHGMITAVRSEKSARRRKGIAIPAMPNLHSHAHQRLMQGLAERSGTSADSFWTWREIMYRFALMLEPEDLEAVATQLYVEMLKAGFSVVGEFQYLHHQPDGKPYPERAELSLCCIAASDAAGIGITILPTLYNFGGFGGQVANEGQRRFLNDADGFLRIVETLDLVCRHQPTRRLGISPHSLRAVTPELLNTVLSNIDPTLPIHIHAAEQVKEVQDCLAWSGLQPLSFLLDHFDLSDRWTVIHATHMTPEETGRLARSGATAGLCPTTEANLGDGIFPATQFLEEGGRIGIGSDSQISVSPAEDLRLLEYSQRLRDLSRNALAGGPERSTGRRIFDAALLGGAQALQHPVGRIATGYRADIVVLDETNPQLAGRSGDAVLDSWIFSGGNALVKDVYVAGRRVIADGHHADEDRIARNFRKTVKRLSA